MHENNRKHVMKSSNNNEKWRRNKKKIWQYVTIIWKQ